MKYDFLDIKRITYNGSCVLGPMVNNFEYDGEHRITDMNTSMSLQGLGFVINGFNTHYEYDHYGNLNLLQRHSYNIQTNTTSLIDDLDYNYVNHELVSIEDLSGNNDGLPAVVEQDPMVYDSNGNMTYFPNKGINSIYNFLNLPFEITKDGNTMEFSYFADGSVYEKTSANSTKRNIGSYEFIDGELTYIYHSDGRFIKEENEFRSQYFLKDHLGNTVVVFEDINGDAGKTLNTLTNLTSYELTSPLWKYASKSFARGASGKVHVFHNGSKGIRLQSVWAKTEYPILKNNVSLIYHTVH